MTDLFIRRVVSVGTLGASLLLFGCGGGGGDSGGGSSPAATSVDVPITVVDGLIQNANVCLDKNNNGTCESGEPSGKTDVSGKVTLKVDAADAGKYPVIAVVGTDATDADTGAVPVAFTLKAPADKPNVISPLTTLVQSAMSSKGMNSTDAESYVRKQMGLNVSLFDDFIKETTADHKTAATVARMVVVTTQRQFTALASSVGAAATDGAKITKTDVDGVIQQHLLDILPTLLPASKDLAIFSAKTTADKENALLVQANVLVTNSGLTVSKVATIVADGRKVITPAPTPTPVSDSVSKLDGKFFSDGDPEITTYIRISAAGKTFTEWDYDPTDGSCEGVILSFDSVENLSKSLEASKTVASGSGFTSVIDGVTVQYNPVSSIPSKCSSLTLTPVAAPTPTSHIKSIVAGSGSNSFAIKDDGTVWAWGANFLGGVTPSVVPSFITKPVQIPELKGYDSIVPGFGTSYAIDKSGNVVGWGRNNNGLLLKPPSTKHLDKPTSIGFVAKSLAASGGSTVAVAKNGDLFGWGANISGFTINTLVPVKISAKSNFVSVAAGDLFFIALNADGSVWTFGYSQRVSNVLGRPNSGNLSDGSMMDSSSPQLMPTLKDVAKIWACEDSGYALKTDGTLWAWGSNTYGQLGDGTHTYREYPVQINGEFSTLSARYRHVLALKKDGSLWAWGQGSSGQLLNNSRQGASSPTKVGENYIKIAAGVDYSLAESATGEIYGAGFNSRGELGDGTEATPGSGFYVTEPTKTLLFDNTAGAGLAGTWCTDVSGDENCWVFDNNTGSSNGSFYQQSINQYSGTLTNTMTWSVQGGNLTYRFTRSTLSNSPLDYDNPFNGKTYTFPYKVSGSSFIFQGITFTKK